MAELPRYQPTGYLPADIPRLEFANIKEQISMTQGINSALDRLSNFAFKEAAEKAQREGMQYGAENMPSTEQVMTAMKEGKSPAELFAKPGTYFGDAARKVQAGQLRSELEVLGRQELANLSAAVDTKTFNLEQLQTTIKSLTTGYAKAISAVDAEEGLKFRSSMATAGNAVYVKATENFAKIVAEGKIILAGDALAATSTIIADTLKSETDPTMLSARIKVEANRVFEIAMQTGDPAFVKTAREDFEKTKINAIIEYAISKDFAPTEIDGYRKLVTRDFGKLSEVMKTVNLDKLKTQWLEKTGNIIESNNKANALSLSLNQDKVYEIFENVRSGKIGGQDAHRQIRALGVTLPDGQMKELLSGEGAGATPKEFGNYESMTQRGLLGENDINSLAEKGKMSWTQANKLKQQARNPDSQMRDALSYARAAVGAPGEMTFGFGYEKQRYERIQSQLREKKYDASQTGKPFDPMQTVKDIIKADSATVEHKQYESELQDFKDRLKRNNIKFDENRIYTEKDLKDLGKREKDILLDMQTKLKRDRDQ